nr:hypothetical protein [Tanacetum cinerariifolium]
MKQKARILDAIENKKFQVKKKCQLLHSNKLIGFPTHLSCVSSLHNSFDTRDLIRVVPTYRQYKDNKDAQHQAIQGNNLTITELIHVEYSLDDNSKPETTIVIEEDEKLTVEITTKATQGADRRQQHNARRGNEQGLSSEGDSTPNSSLIVTDNTTLLQALQVIQQQQQLQQQSQLLSQLLSQQLQHQSQQQMKQKARILDATENKKIQVKKKCQLLHSNKLIGFPTHLSCVSSLHNSFDTRDLIRVVPTYRQDEDAQHQAIQGDNPTITEPIHVEYSLNDNSKPETTIVIEEDEKLAVEITTKLHKVPTEDNSIMPEEETNKDSPLKEIQHQIVLISRDKSDNLMSLSRHCISHYPMVQIEGLSELNFKTRSRLLWNEVKSNYFVKRSSVKGGLIMADTRKVRHLSTYNKFRNKEKKKPIWSTTIPPDELELLFIHIVHHTVHKKIVIMTDNIALLQALQVIQQQLQQQQLQQQQLQQQSQLLSHQLQHQSQQQMKQKARILDVIENKKFQVKKKSQLLHINKVIGFPTHLLCVSSFHNFFETHDLIRVVPTYHQDKDDQDAQHQAIQGDNPTITEPIHVEYSLDDNSKPETPIVIEEDEKLTVEITTKLHKVPTEDNNIMPEEETSKDSPLKEIQHQIVPRLDMTQHWSGVGAAPLMSPRQDETSEPLLYVGWMAGPYWCKDATRGRNDDPVTHGWRYQVPMPAYEGPLK